MARAGVASRRECETLIEAGRVRVNGEKVTRPGVRIDPDADEVSVDGRVIELAVERAHLMLHKPAGYVTSVKDTHGRPVVMDLVTSLARGLFPVGRLDKETTGLLLITNDGDLANHLIHPRYHVSKTYEAAVEGHITAESLARLEAGVELEDGPTAPARAWDLGGWEHGSVVRLVLHEGRKRQARRMLASVGHPVARLARVRFGPLALGGLPEGATRELTSAEIAALRSAAGTTPRARGNGAV